MPPIPVPNATGCLVNSLNAFVIPQSRNVMRGDSYSADIVLAAVDTTRLPAIYMDGVRLAGNGGHIDILAMSPGLHTHSGYLEVTHDDGTVIKSDIRSRIGQLTHMKCGFSHRLLTSADIGCNSNHYIGADFGRT